MPFAVRIARVALPLAALGCAGLGDAAPETTVLLDNRYPTATTNALVVYRASFQAVTFTDPVLPGSTSDPQNTVAASENRAYVVLAPGWDPKSPTPPSSLVVLRSRAGFAVHLGDALHIPVDDATFAGNCAAGSSLSQRDADFVTRLVFPADFANVRYDAATCTTAAAGAPTAGDAGAR